MIETEIDVEIAARRKFPASKEKICDTIELSMQKIQVEREDFWTNGETKAVIFGESSKTETSYFYIWLVNVLCKWYTELSGKIIQGNYPTFGQLYR